MSKKKKRKQQFSVSPEEIQRIEEKLGVKFLDFYEGIFKFYGITWKPVKNGVEHLYASLEGVPMIKISAGHSTCHFVPLVWKP